MQNKHAVDGQPEHMQRFSSANKDFKCKMIKKGVENKGRHEYYKISICLNSFSYLVIFFNFATQV